MQFIVPRTAWNSEPLHYGALGVSLIQVLINIRQYRKRKKKKTPSEEKWIRRSREWEPGYRERGWLRFWRNVTIKINVTKQGRLDCKVCRAGGDRVRRLATGRT